MGRGAAQAAAGGLHATDRAAAVTAILRREAAGEIATGLLYLDEEPVDCHAILGTTETPLNALAEAQLIPGEDRLAAVNASFR